MLTRTGDLFSEGYRFVQAVRSPFTGNKLGLVLASNTPSESMANCLPETAGVEGQLESVIDMERTVLLIVWPLLRSQYWPGCSVARESVRGASGNEYASEARPTEVLPLLDLR